MMSLKGQYMIIWLKMLVPLVMLIQTADTRDLV